MKRMYVIPAILAAACGAQRAAAAELKIVTTTSDLAAIARAVAGDKAEVHSICTGKEDPHMLQAKPSVILQARDADLWIRIGLELEIGWEPPILDGSRNNRIRPGAPGHMDASESALVLDIPQGAITRAMGDVHPSGNPHYWLDPLNGRCIAGAIAERLAQLRPADADTFRANATTFQKALDERMFGAELVKAVGGEALWAKTVDGSLVALLAESGNKAKTGVPRRSTGQTGQETEGAGDGGAKAGGWAMAMAPLRGQRIVTYHRSWVYFAHRFGLEIAAELEPKPGVPPTAAHLAALAESANAEGVKVILQEPFYSPKAANQLAGKIGARVVVVANSVGGQPEATDYLTLMDLIVGKVCEPR